MDRHACLLRPNAPDQTRAEGDAVAPGIEEGVFFRQELGGVDLLDEGAGAFDFPGRCDDAGEHGGFALMPTILGQGDEETCGIHGVALLRQGQGFEEAEVNILRVGLTTVANDGEQAVHFLASEEAEVDEGFLDGFILHGGTADEGTHQRI